MAPPETIQICRLLPYSQLGAPPNSPNPSSSEQVVSRRTCPLTPPESPDIQESTQSLRIEHLQKLLLQLMEVKSLDSRVSVAPKLDTVVGTHLEEVMAEGPKPKLKTVNEV
jgi:hypothetical protein